MSHIVVRAAEPLIKGIDTALVEPLWRLMFGSGFEISVGPFPLVPLLSGFVGSLLSVVICTFSVVLLLRISWRWIDKVISKSEEQRE